MVRAAGASGIGQWNLFQPRRVKNSSAPMTTVSADAMSAHRETDDLPWAVWDEGVEAKMLARLV